MYDMKDTTFRFHVRTITFGWSTVVMYINDKRISFNASYLGESPIESMIKACLELVSRDEDSIKWHSEPGYMKIGFVRYDESLMINVLYSDEDETEKTEEIEEIEEIVSFDDFQNAIISEGFRVLNAFGLCGYYNSWMNGTEFPLTELLYITGKCKTIWKGDSRCTNLSSEIDIIKEFISVPEFKRRKYPECTLYYESWQLNCCGESFAVGDKIEWPCLLPKHYKNAHGTIIDFEEDHHGFATHVISGTIQKIYLERSEFPKGQRETWYHKAKTIKEEVSNVDAKYHLSDTETTEQTLWGYIVELKDVKVKIIKKDVELGSK